MTCVVLTPETRFRSALFITPAIFPLSLRVYQWHCGDSVIYLGSNDKACVFSSPYGSALFRNVCNFSLPELPAAFTKLAN